ncbi:hypothetical protein DFH06DRAFT_1195909 [Mycena polygramma]|nr:hypothetical protein DFH06DRAFT_1195909 [Mycena polygramma]
MCQEGTLILHALEYVVHGTFEADWAALEMDRKQELVLEGLYRGACAAGRENSHVDCPEMTISGLAGNKEYSRIRMRIVAHDPTGNGRVKTIFLFAHPYLEYETRHTDAAPDMVKAILYWKILFRNFYIVETLRGVLDAYHDRPAVPVTPGKPPILRTEGRRQERPTFRTEFKKLNQHVDQSQYKEESAVAVYACYACRIQKDHDALKRCGGCYLARYCSRYALCTGRILKTDSPDRKKFCGALEFVGCHTPVAGYRALWHQISKLSKADSRTQDYHFDMPSPGATRSVCILDPPAAQIVFLVARRRAMASGCVDAIHMIFAILKCGYLSGAYGEIEYRVTTTDYAVVGGGHFAPPTKQELEEERVIRNSAWL